MNNYLDIVVEFSGELKTLFGHQSIHHIQLPITKDPLLDPPTSPTIGDLIKYLSEQLMQDSRKHLFIKEDTVRPGILVLINNDDWELKHGINYILQPKDVITFISTLHGG
ncbi:hypothetical protein PCK2_000645 [Pneumocystis canis]|nr:hypothetical protein PCK2_000645 [Pneumocystis canis]